MSYNIAGNVRQVIGISGSVEQKQTISGKLNIQWVGDTSPPYTGTYEVTPKVTPQVLETQGKRMEKDVSVNGIPVSVIENQAKGNTVFIG